GTRICAQLTAESVLDLNYAYARYLLESENEQRPYEVASARLPSDMLEFIAGGETSIEAARQSIDFVNSLAEGNNRGISGERLIHSMSEIRLHAPVPRPGKILAAGKNYGAHVLEAAKAAGVEADLPPFPRGFVKTSCTVIGNEDDVELPHVTENLNYEVELA